MAAFNDRLVQKGRGQPGNALAQQAEVTFGLCEKHQPDLIAFGLPPDTVVQGRAILTEVKSTAGTLQEARDVSAAAARFEVSTRSTAKKLKRSIALAAQLGLSTEVPEEAKALETMRAGGAKDSTRLLIDYLDRVQPHLVTYEDKLKPFFKGESPLPRLAEVKAALEQADARQEMLRASLPSETLKHYEAKGRLLEIIERINHVAQLAFDGQADRIGLFNKDILLRARRSGGHTSTEDPVEDPDDKTPVNPPNPEEPQKPE